MAFSMKKFKYTSDGQVDAKSARTLHELLGIKKSLNLPYENLASLEKALKTMNLVDMQALAIKMEVKPVNDRTRLTRVLTDQFIRLHKSYGCAMKRPEEAKDKEFDPKDFSNE